MNIRVPAGNRGLGGFEGFLDFGFAGQLNLVSGDKNLFFQAIQGVNDLFPAGFAADDQADGVLLVRVLFVAPVIANIFIHLANVPTVKFSDL